ncbi:Protein of unknown function [Pyronema omphalodes CBS 100304]|uniref:Secreted protein n=1 Tax=Pyronema omphalodes (strain CBS 100304) TaxID=1076935 RepID=U4KWR1_PYROM|nr:Protein of unknown function [Pyronema omphalodes CBS 100304]
MIISKQVHRLLLLQGCCFFVCFPGPLKSTPSLEIECNTPESAGTMKLQNHDRFLSDGSLVGEAKRRS